MGHEKIKIIPSPQGSQPDSIWFTLGSDPWANEPVMFRYYQRDCTYSEAFYLFNALRHYGVTEEEIDAKLPGFLEIYARMVIARSLK